MKNFALTVAVALGVSASSLVASASTTTYYSADTQGAASSSSAVVTYLGYQAFGSNAAPNNGGSSKTYGLPLNQPGPTASVWVGIPGETASLDQGWVSYNSGTYINGPTSAPFGNYFYSATFSATAGDTVTLNVLVDDTATVSVNSFNSVITPTGTTTNSDCLTGSPNCYSISSYNISSYINAGTGINTLIFDVSQQHGPATGLNFSITDTTAATPEPSSLMLLGTGVLGAAGMVRRRIAA